MDNIRKEKKSLDETKHKLLDKALSSTKFGQKKQKSDDEEASAKKLNQVWGKVKTKTKMACLYLVLNLTYKCLQELWT